MIAEEDRIIDIEVRILSNVRTFEIQGIKKARWNEKVQRISL